jgi:hypothetical protein
MQSDVRSIVMQGAAHVAKLNDKNYEDWRSNIENLFSISNDLSRCLFTKPPTKNEDGEFDDVDEKQAKDWWTDDNFVHMVLFQTIAPQCQQQVKDTKTAKERYEILTTTYRKNKKATKAILKETLAAKRMSEGEDMLKHLNELTSAAKGLRAIGVAFDDDDLVQSILDSLPSSYSQMVTSFKCSLENLTSEKVRDVLLLEAQKRQHKATEDEHPEVAAYSINKASTHELRRSSQDRREEGSNSPACQICDKRGHNARDCSERKQKHSVQHICQICDERGHTAKDCRLRNDDTSNLLGEPRNSEDEDCKPTSNQRRVGGSTLFFMKSYERPQNDNIWYVDSGATNHLTGQRKWFTNYKKLDVPINLVGINGFTKAVGKGDIGVRLQGESIILHNVYHVPDAFVNLFSVGQTIRNGSIVKFEDGKCIIREPDGRITVCPKNDNNNMFELELEPTLGQMYTMIADAPGSDHAQLSHHHRDHSCVDDNSKEYRPKVIEGSNKGKFIVPKDVIFDEKNVEEKMPNTKIDDDDSENDDDINAEEKLKAHRRNETWGLLQSEEKKDQSIQFESKSAYSVNKTLDDFERYTTQQLTFNRCLTTSQLRHYRVRKRAFTHPRSFSTEINSSIKKFVRIDLTLKPGVLASKPECYNC